jgi:cyclopropane-fatty-acyl-phospholipid synthase
MKSNETLLSPASSGAAMGAANHGELSESDSVKAAASLPAATLTTLDLLQRLQGGALQVNLPSGVQHLVGHGDLCATLSVHELRTFERALGEGDIGFAESYLDGDWETDNLSALLTLLAENRERIAQAIHGRWWPVLRHKIMHWTRANTRRGSRRNILSHYDLGNNFYQHWLDPSMTYSSALFTKHSGGSATLEEAQRAKYRHILDTLKPKPGQTILEVGCGWGGFAEVAARDYGCRVHGVTLSPAQLEFAQARAQKGGWSDRAHFELLDYRDLRCTYDHIVSIEMFEAVGERYWPSYFRQLRRCLKPGGRALVQTITIANERFSAYRRGTDFIQRHIFPGGMLPSPQIFEDRANKADFQIIERLSFGADYARTLAQWRDRFESAWPQIAALGFDARFRQLWRFYLAYCEAGFTTRATDVYQFVLEPF